MVKAKLGKGNAHQEKIYQTTNITNTKTKYSLITRIITPQVDQYATMTSMLRSFMVRDKTRSSTELTNCIRKLAGTCTSNGDIPVVT